METKQITKHEKPLRKVGYFAHLNKNNTIEDYEEEVLKGEYDKSDVSVVKTIEVDYVTYAGLQNTFLSDNPMWDTIGGHEIKPEAKELNPELFEDIEKTEAFWELSKEAVEFWRENSLTLVVEVVCKEKEKGYDADFRFFVDTSGHNYARYVGLSEERFNRLMYREEKQELDNERSINDLSYEDYDEKHKKLAEKYSQKLNKWGSLE